MRVSWGIGGVTGEETGGHTQLASPDKQWERQQGLTAPCCCLMESLIDFAKNI